MHRGSYIQESSDQKTYLVKAEISLVRNVSLSKVDNLICNAEIVIVFSIRFICVISTQYLHTTLHDKGRGGTHGKVFKVKWTRPKQQPHKHVYTQINVPMVPEPEYFSLEITKHTTGAPWCY